MFEFDLSVVPRFRCHLQLMSSAQPQTVISMSTSTTAFATSLSHPITSSAVHITSSLSQPITYSSKNMMSSLSRQMGSSLAYKKSSCHEPTESQPGPHTTAASQSEPSAADSLNLKSSNMFIKSKSSGAMTMCGQCDSCMAERHVLDVQAWFQRTKDDQSVQSRFLCGLVDRVNSIEHLMKIQHLMRSLALKDAVYTITHGCPTADSAAGVIPANCDEISATDHLVMSSIWAWFDKTDYWSKTQFIMTILQLCSTNLLFGVGQRVASLVLAEIARLGMSGQAGCELKEEIFSTGLHKKNPGEEMFEICSERDVKFLHDVWNTVHPAEWINFNASSLLHLKSHLNKDTESMTAGQDGHVMTSLLTRMSEDDDQRDLELKSIDGLSPCGSVKHEFLSEDIFSPAVRTSTAIHRLKATDVNINPQIDGNFSNFGKIDNDSSVSSSANHRSRRQPSLGYQEYFYKDFIRSLPVHLSKYILNLLDQESRGQCWRVCRQWRTLVDEVIREKRLIKQIQQEVKVMQGSMILVGNPRYANDVMVAVPNVNPETFQVIPRTNPSSPSLLSSSPLPSRHSRSSHSPSRGVQSSVDETGASTAVEGGEGGRRGGGDAIVSHLSGQRVDQGDGEDGDRGSSRGGVSVRDHEKRLAGGSERGWKGGLSGNGVYFERAYPGCSTRNVLIEERNEYCGPYNVLVITDRVDSSRVVSMDNSKLIAIGSDDKRIKIVNSESNQILLPLISGHVASVTCVALCEKRGFIVSGSFDTTIRKWSLTTRKCLRIYQGHCESVLTLSLHTRYLASGSQDKTCKVWDVDSGKCWRTFKHKQNVTAVHVNDDLCISGCAAGVVKVWHLKTGDIIKKLTGHRGPMTVIKFDQWHIVTAAMDSSVLVWTTQGDYTDCVQALRHPKDVLCLAFLYLRAVTGCVDGKIRIWNVATGQCMRIMRGNSVCDPIKQIIAVDNRLLVNTRSSTLLLKFEPINYEYTRSYIETHPTAYSPLHSPPTTTPHPTATSPFSAPSPPVTRFSKTSLQPAYPSPATPTTGIESPFKVPSCPVYPPQTYSPLAAPHPPDIKKDEPYRQHGTSLRSRTRTRSKIFGPTDLTRARSARALRHDRLMAEAQHRSAVLRENAPRPPTTPSHPSPILQPKYRLPPRPTPRAPHSLDSSSIHFQDREQTALIMHHDEGQQAVGPGGRREDGAPRRRISWAFEYPAVLGIQSFDLAATKSFLRKRIRHRRTETPEFLTLAIREIHAKTRKQETTPRKSKQEEGEEEEEEAEEEERKEKGPPGEESRQPERSPVRRASSPGRFDTKIIFSAGPTNKVVQPQLQQQKHRMIFTQQQQLQQMPQQQVQKQPQQPNRKLDGGSHSAVGLTGFENSKIFDPLPCSMSGERLTVTTRITTRLVDTVRPSTATVSRSRSAAGTATSTAFGPVAGSAAGPAATGPAAAGSTCGAAAASGHVNETSIHRPRLNLRPHSSSVILLRSGDEEIVRYKQNSPLRCSSAVSRLGSAGPGQDWASVGRSAGRPRGIRSPVMASIVPMLMYNRCESAKICENGLKGKGEEGDEGVNEVENKAGEIIQGENVGEVEGVRRGVTWAEEDGRKGGEGKSAATNFSVMTSQAGGRERAKTAGLGGRLRDEPEVGCRFGVGERTRTEVGGLNMDEGRRVGAGWKGVHFPEEGGVTFSATDMFRNQTDFRLLTSQQLDEMINNATAAQR